MSKEGISVVVTVTERVDNLVDIIATYGEIVASTGREFEIICVLDGKFAHLESSVKKAQKTQEHVRVIGLSRVYGESVALSIAIEQAKFDLILTLPSYHQVAANSVPDLLNHIDEADIVVARRWPRKDSAVNRFSNKVFHVVLRWITQVPFRDIGCGVRLLKKHIFSEITIYGDQHRFLPVLADRRGFKVVEIDLPQAKSDLGVRVYSPRVYVSRILDLIGVFFIARFTKKPLRFFGMIGTILGTAGVGILLIAVLQRYVFATPMADRPVLLLGSLCLVLGAQLFALGLVGELIIFTHARDLKEYAIAETVNMDDGRSQSTGH